MGKERNSRVAAAELQLSTAVVVRPSRFTPPPRFPGPGFRRDKLQPGPMCLSIRTEVSARLLGPGSCPGQRWGEGKPTKTFSPTYIPPPSSSSGPPPAAPSPPLTPPRVILGPAPRSSITAAHPTPSSSSGPPPAAPSPPLIPLPSSSPGPPPGGSITAVHLTPFVIPGPAPRSSIATTHPTPFVILGLDPGIRRASARAAEVVLVGASSVPNPFTGCLAASDPRVKPKDDAGEGGSAAQKTYPRAQTLVPFSPHGVARDEDAYELPARPIRVPCGSPQGRPKADGWPDEEPGVPRRTPERERGTDGRLAGKVGTGFPVRQPTH